MTLRNAAAAALAVLLLAAACPAKKPDSPGGEPRVALRQDFAPGTYTIAQISTNEQKIVTGADTPPVSLKMSQDMTSELTASQGDAEGNKTLTLTFKAIKASVPGAEYDSAAQQPPKPSRLARVYDPLLKAKLVTVIDKQGRVVSSKGLNDLWDSLAKADPSFQDTAERMKAFLGDERMNRRIFAAAPMLPDKPVGPGALWHAKITQDMPVIGKATTEFECELTDLTKGPAGQIAVIQFTGDLTSQGGGTMKVSGRPAEVGKVHLQQSGRIVLNVDTGVVLEHTVDQKGKIAMSLAGPDNQKMDLTSDITSSTKTTVTPGK